MFSPTNHAPITNTFTSYDFENKTATTRTNYTHNYADMQFRARGNGRDSYVYNDNGGFFSPQRVAPNQNPPGSFPAPRHPRHGSVSPRQAAAVDIQRPKIYNQDGTGRDTYIMSNSGGFTTHGYVPVATDPRIIFKKSLRSYQPNPDYLASIRRRQHIVKSRDSGSPGQKSYSPGHHAPINSAEPRARNRGLDIDLTADINSNNNNNIQGQTLTNFAPNLSKIQKLQQQNLPERKRDFVTTYMNALCGENETLKERSNDVKKIQAKYLNRRVTTNKNTRNQSPQQEVNVRTSNQQRLPLNLKPVTNNNEEVQEIQPLQISSARVVQTNHNMLMTQNSIDQPPNSSRIQTNETEGSPKNSLEAPTLRMYNPSPESVRKMHSYLNKLDNRLSVPKTQRSENRGPVLTAIKMPINKVFSPPPQSTQPDSVMAGISRNASPSIEQKTSIDGIKRIVQPVMFPNQPRSSGLNFSNKKTALHRINNNNAAAVVLSPGKMEPEKSALKVPATTTGGSIFKQKPEKLIPTVGNPRTQVDFKNVWSNQVVPTVRGNKSVGKAGAGNLTNKQYHGSSFNQSGQFQLVSQSSLIKQADSQQSINGLQSMPTMGSYNNGHALATDRAGGMYESFNPAASIEASNSLNFSINHNTAHFQESLN